ncbi:MAG: D-Ala-D-Ala carboxypeptidase family metallohydrolase [Pseudomonadota bacterium]
MRRAFRFPAAVFAVAIFTLASSAQFPAMQSVARAAAPQSCLPGSLKATLSAMRKRFGAPIILSTHRPGATIRGTGRRSLHASCRAVDFHPPRGKYKAVLAWLKRNHNGGLGTYSGRHSHIHIDNGPRTRWHKSY